METKSTPTNFSPKAGIPVSSSDSETQSKKRSVAKTSLSRKKLKVEFDSIEPKKKSRNRTQNINTPSEVIPKQLSEKADIFRAIKHASLSEKENMKITSEKAFSLRLPYVFSRDKSSGTETNLDASRVAKEMLRIKPLVNSSLPKDDPLFDKLGIDRSAEDPISWEKGKEKHEFYCIFKRGDSPLHLGSLEGLAKRGISNDLALLVLSLPNPNLESGEEFPTEVNRGRVFFSVLLSEGLLFKKDEDTADYLIQGIPKHQVNKIKADLLVLSAGPKPNVFFKTLLRSGDIASIRSGEFEETPLEIAKEWGNEENIALLKMFGVDS